MCLQSHVLFVKRLTLNYSLTEEIEREPESRAQNLKYFLAQKTSSTTITCLCWLKMVVEVTITLLHLPSTLKMLERPEALRQLISVLLFLFFIATPFPNEILVLQGCLIEKLQFPVVSGSSPSPQSPEAVGPTTGGDPVPSDTRPHTQKVECC